MMRIQTTRDSASTSINGIRFAAHPSPPDGGKLLVSEPLDDDDERVDALLGIPGFATAGDYGADVLRVVDAAIKAEAASAATAADAARDQTRDELGAANHNLSRTVSELRAENVTLKRQIGESAVGELQAEVARLQDRVKDAEARTGGDGAAEAEAENARLRDVNASLTAELAGVRHAAEAVQGEKAALEQQLVAIKADVERLTKDAKPKK